MSMQVFNRHPYRIRTFGGYLIQMILAALLLWSGTALALEVSTTFSSRKSGEVPQKTGETEFTCSDTIYALIQTRGLPEGTHDIEIHWIDPLGERQELTRFSAYTSGDDTLLWGWLRLHAPEDSGLVRAFDPSHGMRTFIGQWTVRIYIDGKQVDTRRFDVLC